MQIYIINPLAFISRAKKIAITRLFLEEPKELLANLKTNIY
jgi:hypothetical protein